MMSAVRNFTMISCGLAFFTSAVWVILRLSSQSQPVAPPLKHPFLSGPIKSVVAYHPTGPGSELERLVRAAAIDPNVVIWVEARGRLDGAMVMATGDENLENGAPLLKDVLPRFPKNRVILNFRGNREGMIQAYAKAVEEAGAAGRILAQSPENGFLISLREGKPEWLYGTSAPAITRFVMLSSIGLAALAPLKGDVIVIESSPREHALERMSASLIDEAHRRGMKIFAGPAANDEQALALWNGSVDGVLTERPEALWGLTHKP